MDVLLWLQLVLAFIRLLGFEALPAAGQCVPSPGPTVVTTVEEHRPWCLDANGTLREQARWQP